MKTIQSILSRISYCNYRKQYPNIGPCFADWFYIRKYWSGKLIHIGIKHHCVVLDLRGDWVSDMMQ